MKRLLVEINPVVGYIIVIPVVLALFFLLLGSYYSAAFPPTPQHPGFFGEVSPAGSGFQILMSAGGFSHWMALFMFWFLFALILGELYMVVRWFASAKFREAVERRHSAMGTTLPYSLAITGLAVGMMFTSEPQGLHSFLIIWFLLVLFMQIAPREWPIKPKPSAPEGPVSGGTTK